MQHGDIVSLSIYANGLRQTPNKDVMHGDIREVSLVVAGANPGAFIDFVDMAHGEGGEQEMILSAYEPISLYRPDEKPPLIHKADTKEKPDDKPNAGEDGDKPKDGDKSKGKEKPEDEGDHRGCCQHHEREAEEGHVRSDCCCRGAGERQRRG